MGSVPVAKPKPLPRGWPSPRRGFLLGLLLLGVVAVGGVGLASVWPETAPPLTQPHWVRVADEDDVIFGEPLPVPEHRLFLVKQPDGDILALWRQSPFMGCAVPWNPSFTMDGATGWFRDPCHSGTFDLTGACYAPQCPRGMDRFEVRVSGDDVEVFVGGAAIPGPPVDTSIPSVNPPQSKLIQLRLDDRAQGTPAYFVNEGIFLVELEDDEFVALSARSPHLGCQLEWRTDYVRDGGKRWFVDPCSGSVFDGAGYWYFGPASRGMDRFPVTVGNGSALVDVGARLCQPRFYGYREDPYTHVEWSAEACAQRTTEAPAS